MRDMRCASPSTPTSCRMMSWMDLTVLRTDMLFRDATATSVGLAARQPSCGRA
jgi:hypothetical protein